MTSNLGSDIIQEQAGTNDYATLKSKVMNVLVNEFRPEFINRIDETVVFHPLANEHIKEIADIQLVKLRERLTEMGYLLEISDAALEKIASSGFDPVYGARPLKRAIQQTIENPLAQQLLGGEYNPGDIVVIDANEQGLIFSKR
jgi:ATP-dependent Clp protease ATP-binding subunit ClpB